MSDPHRSSHRSPEAVLAEARRLAADIRRRAEHDASAIRREAAEWAARTRRDAERYRTQVMAELELTAARAGAPAEPETPAEAPEAPAEPPAAPRPAPSPSVVVDPGSGAVIDLRTAAEARRAAEATPPPGNAAVNGEHDAVRDSVRRTFNRRFP